MVRGDYGSAVREARTAKNLMANSGLSDVELSARLNVNLGMVLGRAGKLHESAQALQEAVEIYRREVGNDSLTTWSSQESLGLALGRLGEYARAEELISEAAQNQRRLGGETVWYAESLFDLAGIEIKRKSFASALENIAAAEHTWTQAFGPDRKGGQISLSRGLILLAQEQTQAALEQFDHSLALLHKSLPSDHPSVIEAQLGKCETLVHMGRASEALPIVENTMPLARAKFGQNHPITMEALYCAGLVHAATGDAMAARDAFNEILERGPEAYDGATNPVFTEMSRKVRGELR